MDLLKYLREQFDDDTDIEQMWTEIQARFGSDDFVQFANIIVLIDQLPKELTQRFWNNI